MAKMLQGIPVVAYRDDGGIAIGELWGFGSAAEFRFAEVPWINPGVENFVRKARELLKKLAPEARFKTRMEREKFKKAFEDYLEAGESLRPRPVPFKLEQQPGPATVAVAVCVEPDLENPNLFAALVGLGSEAAQELGAFSFENLGFGFLISSSSYGRERLFRYVNRVKSVVEAVREKGLYARFGVALGPTVPLRPGLTVSPAQPLAVRLAQAEVDGFLGFLNLTHWYRLRRKTIRTDKSS